VKTIFFRKKQKRTSDTTVPVTAVQTAGNRDSFSELESFVPLPAGERRLYDALRESVPIIDAAICKILHLVGTFQVHCPDRTVEDGLNNFLRNVKAGAAGMGIQTFLSTYLSDLLTYGNAVGEMIVADGKVAALYNASLDDVELKAVSPLEIQVCRMENGSPVPVKYPELVFCSALNPPSGSATGVSILHGLPFVSNILLEIYRTIGVNWQRLGNVRFAVTYKPSSDAMDQAYAKERAEQIADEWGRAMRGKEVSDFVSVGDLSIKAIGSDCQILDSEVPVREMLEQIVAKLDIPPFLLGLSWSSTERMSSQQADILTSELKSYRCILDPVIGQICTMWMHLAGKPADFTIDWDNITLQDAVELASAHYQNVKAEQIERQTAAIRPGK
jgi:hypothetical protein